MYAALTDNPIMDTDSYKASHWLQYPPDVTSMYSYFESRGGRYRDTVFFGLQYYLREHLSRPVTARDVDEAATFFAFATNGGGKNIQVATTTATSLGTYLTSVSSSVTNTALPRICPSSAFMASARVASAPRSSLVSSAYSSKV